MPPLSILIWLPAACGTLGAILAGARGAASGAAAGAPATVPTTGVRRRVGAIGIPGALALVGAIAALVLAIAYIADYNPSGARLQHVTDVVWISELGIHYKLAVDGLNVALVGLTALLFAAATIAANLRDWERPGLFFFF